MTTEIRCGDALEVLRTMQDESVQCVVTSPPYWGLRDYGIEGQLGLERTPEEYVAHLVEVFREVRRVLREDGTLWLVIGDSYARQSGSDNSKKNTGQQAVLDGNGYKLQSHSSPDGLKPKDLVGIPWMVAFALRSDGWYLRSDIIWSKPNPMPESVTDRPTKAHEYVFLLAKSARYYYDAEAIKEPLAEGTAERYAYGFNAPAKKKEIVETGMWHTGKNGRDNLQGDMQLGNGRNKRTVWNVPTRPYKGAHFATFPPKLVEPMILAGCPVGGTILDPFCGSGTVGAVCVTHSRLFIGIELNPSYIALAEERIAKARESHPAHLRTLGRSIPEIAKQLKMSVPQVVALLHNGAAS